jgi:NAD(P)-dependent dehydrogenase (short-subunit alcohol dehydrogenase family)
VWINNAGVSPRFMRLWELTAQELRDVVDTNVSGVMLGSWVAMRGMRAQSHGIIYNIVGFGSDGTTFPGTLPYGASKRTVAYLSKALAREAKGSPVKVCTLDPCGVRTEMTALTWGAMREANPVMGAMIDILALDPPACARLLAPRILANTRSGALIRPWNAGVFWLRTLTLARRRPAARAPEHAAAGSGAHCSSACFSAASVSVGSTLCAERRSG